MENFKELSLTNVTGTVAPDYKGGPLILLKNEGSVVTDAKKPGLSLQVVTIIKILQ